MKVKKELAQTVDAPVMRQVVIENPIINSPFDEPTRHFRFSDEATEWPTRDFSIKTIAKYLGFAWRDTHTSGAASIEWFDRWLATGDPAIRQRILDYKEDDCRGTRVLLDVIRQLPSQTQGGVT